jgi:hypothetical protein
VPGKYIWDAHREDRRRPDERARLRDTRRLVRRTSWRSEKKKPSDSWAFREREKDEVCAEHKNIPKAKIKKYREARKAKMKLKKAA